RDPRRRLDVGKPVRQKLEHGFPAAFGKPNGTGTDAVTRWKRRTHCGGKGIIALPPKACATKLPRLAQPAGKPPLLAESVLDGLAAMADEGRQPYPNTKEEQC